MQHKPLEWVILLLAFLGAANWAFDKLGFNLLSYLGTGIFGTIGLWAVGLAGGYGGYLLLSKKI